MIFIFYVDPRDFLLEQFQLSRAIEVLHPGVPGRYISAFHGTRDVKF